MKKLKEKLKPIELKFNVLEETNLIVPKSIRIKIKTLEPVNISGLGVHTWFQRMLGNKLVVHVEKSQEVQHLKPHFEFLEVENLEVHYIVKMLFTYLTSPEHLNIEIENFEYETI